MNIGVIGFTQDAKDLVTRLKESGYQIMVYDESEEKRKQISGANIITAPSLEELVFELESKRIIWLFSSDENVLATWIDSLVMHLAVSDILIIANPTSYEHIRVLYQEALGFQIDVLDYNISLKHDEVFVGGNRFAFNYCEKMLIESSPLKLRYTGLIGTSITTKNN
jgi:6-phosphogluconate dehydrogenase